MKKFKNIVEAVTSAKNLDEIQRNIDDFQQYKAQKKYKVTLTFEELDADGKTKKFTTTQAYDKDQQLMVDFCLIDEVLGVIDDETIEKVFANYVAYKLEKK